ncbi:hypothetical protein BJY52DRAFT_1251785 [Lactarius psammicola]|nr:hypothetical protein BJY52DRAFT_1251785 [Lactarius psammicola]
MQLDRQLSPMGQICNNFSPFLFRVQDLRISSTRSSSGQDPDDVGGQQWLEFIGVFSDAKDFHVAGELALCALLPADGEDTTDLPSLHNLCVPVLRSGHGLLWEATKLFINSRWPSGSSVHVAPSSTIFPALCEDEGMSGLPRQYFCTFCNIRFIERQSLGGHNGDQHMPRILCSDCDLFREHLGSKHPELTHIHQCAHSIPA